LKPDPYGQVDLSYTPPSESEVRAKVLRDAIGREPEEEKESVFFSKMSPTELALQGLFLGLGAVDWGQTIKFTQPYNYHASETNPLLGKHPSRARINTMIPLGLALHTAAVWAAPRPIRNVIQALGILGEGAAVRNNFHAGVTPTWPWK
jgi:hypothetical protein